MARKRFITVELGPLRFKQIAIGACAVGYPSESLEPEELLYGLTEEGEVYFWDTNLHGWAPHVMQHKDRRIDGWWCDGEEHGDDGAKATKKVGDLMLCDVCAQHAEGQAEEIA